MTTREGIIGQNIDLGIKFYQNGELYDPYSVSDVLIYDAESGGNLVATIPSVRVSEGYYIATWSIPSSLSPQTLWDVHVWRAEEDMVEKSQTYSFDIVPKSISVDVPSFVRGDVGCRIRPAWEFHVGLGIAEDVGNGMGLRLTWGRALPNNQNNLVHYNIYYADSRFGVFDSWPQNMTTATQVVINVDPGKLQFLAVRAVEFDTSEFDISQLTQVGSNLYEYPEELELQNDIDAYGATIEVGDTTGFPNKGFLLIDTEVILYSSKTNSAFIVEDIDRGAISTYIAAHEAGATVKLWRGIEDQNSVIVSETATWHYAIGVPRNVDAIGQYAVDEDGYRAIQTDLLTTDLSASDENTEDFPSYDYTGYRRSSPQSLFNGECTFSYVGGEFNGGRGLAFQDQNLSRLDSQLQISGEPLILLRRKWTGRKCRCADLRRDHPHSRCAYCFVPGTLVRTETGYRPIEDIAIGDKVLSSSGLFCKVTETMKRSYDGHLVSLKSHVSSRPILTTPEHPFLAMGGNHSSLIKRECGPECEVYIGNGDGNRFNNDVRKAPSGRWHARFSMNRVRTALGTFDTKEEADAVVTKYKNEHIPVGHKLQWMDAKDLDDNPWLVAKWPNQTMDIEYIKVPDIFLKPTRPGMKRNGVNTFTVDTEFMWIIGMYLAEGSSSKRTIQFSLHKKEKEFFDRIKTFFEKLGYKTSVSSHSDNGINIFVNSTTLAKWFLVWLGRGCQNKHIPEELMYLPDQKTQSLINGIYDGDGSKSCNEIGQTSEILALQIMELLHRIGEQPLLRLQQSSILTPKGNVRKLCYINSWAESGLKHANRKNRWKFGEEMLVKAHKTFGIIYYNGPVYNLEVEGNHSYVVNGIVVHNCFGTAFEGGFDRYVNPRPISESYSNTQGYILARIYPYTDDLELDASQSLRQTVELQAWTINIPNIRDRDVLIRLNEDGTEEYRYECLNVVRSKLFFGKTGKQEFTMKRLDKTDEIYTYTISVL